ncbi:MAG: TonB-dependent receptor plug domain-containing protein [Butyricimonas faecihominis]
MRIRGSSSISGSREPVWVVDGVILSDLIPLTPEEINSMDNVNLIGNAISFLNPEDIDRIDILKDASATALYGYVPPTG